MNLNLHTQALCDKPTSLDEGMTNMLWLLMTEVKYTARLGALEANLHP